MIKAVFFDFDDTLFLHSIADIPQSARCALRLLHEKGIKCILCTGRHKLELTCYENIKNVFFDALITLDGQLIYDGQWNELFSAPLEKRTADALLGLFGEGDYPVKLVERDRMFINYIDDYVVNSQIVINTVVPEVGECGDKPLFQAVAYVDETGERVFRERMPDAYIARWSPFAVDIVSPGMSKSVGMELYLNSVGIGREETMAFGDGENDLPMMEYAGLAVAMGNAMDCIKGTADYVTDSIENDGIYNALKHFELI